MATAHQTRAEATASGGIETIQHDVCCVFLAVLFAKAMYWTVRCNEVVSSTARVGKAGSKPALPRNCGERCDDAAPSQTTDRVDGADWTFAGEGGFRRVLIHLPIACGPAASDSSRESAAGW